MRYYEKKGHWPLLKARKPETVRYNSDSDFSSGEDSGIAVPEKSLPLNGIVSEVRSNKS